MKTMLAMSIVLAAACGGQSKANQGSAAARVECTVSLDASSTAADVQQIVDEVSEGSFDPCTGAATADAIWQSARLTRIDFDDGLGRFQLRFALLGYRRLHQP